MKLETIGADERVRADFEPLHAQGLTLGRVCFASHEIYRVLTEEGESEAVPAGRLRFYETLPAMGDWVALRRADASLAWIEGLLPRRTCFSRKAAGEATAEQVIAANVDLALIVMGLDGDFNVRRLERYLILARESGAESLVILNKTDLLPDFIVHQRQVESIAVGLPVLAISAVRNVDALRDRVRGRTVVLLGSSGAGKSTIVNGLLGETIAETAAVRASDSRGRHTTTFRMLIPLPGGGAIIDNPGMRELQLWAGEDSLDLVFEDVAAIAARCRFRDCTHSQEPGCAVAAAIDSGELETNRWESYRKLGRELRYRALEQDLGARLAQKKRWKAVHKAMRHNPKQ